MTSLHDYQNLVDELLTRVDEIHHQISQIDKAINDRSHVDRAHADTETVGANHWNACRDALRASGGESAERLIDSSTPPPTDASDQIVSDQDLVNQRAAVEIAATNYREAELRLQHYQRRWHRRLHRALLAAGVVLGCFVAFIAVKILIGIVSAIIGAISSIAIIAIIAIAVYLLLK